MKKLETFSYLLHRDGCTLYFAVLEQPEEWRSAVLAGLPSADELAGRHVHLGRIKAVQVCCWGEPS